MFGDFYAEYKKACKYYRHPCDFWVWTGLFSVSLVGACVTFCFNRLDLVLALLGFTLIFMVFAFVADWRVSSKIDYTEAELNKHERIRKLLQKYSSAYGLSVDDLIDTLIEAAKNRLTMRAKEDTFKTAALILFPAALSSITNLVPEEYKSSSYYKVLILVLLVAVILFVLLLIIESQVYDMTVNRKNRSYVSFIDDLSIIKRNHTKMELSETKKEKKKNCQNVDDDSEKTALNDLNNTKDSV